MRILENQQKMRGFTLLEMIIATFVIAIALIALMSLIHRAALGLQIASSRLQAAYLAQEGLEIVRNIRDSNWLEEVFWDEGLGSNDWEADYDDLNLTNYVDPGRNLLINGGFYNYDVGTEPTKFKRKIKIAKPSPDILEVTVQISWQERGVDQFLSLQGNLYNWK